jgi:hypothetical protein
MMRRSTYSTSTPGVQLLSFTPFIYLPYGFHISSFASFSAAFEQLVISQSHRSHRLLNLPASKGIQDHWTVMHSGEQVRRFNTCVLPGRQGDGKLSKLPVPKQNQKV